MHIPDEKDLPAKVNDPNDEKVYAVVITYRKILGYNDSKEPIYGGYDARYSKESGWLREK